jgi:hypothetical protein
MEKYAEVSLNKAVIMIILILAHLSLIGCADVGRMVSADNRILLNDQATNQGVFSHSGLTVEYSYSLAGESLTLAGKVNYRTSVDSLNVYILFLDATGTVLQKKIVYYSGYRISRDLLADRSFKDTLVVPPGTAGMSFSYSAQPRNNPR